LPCDDARYIEQIVDQTRQVRHLALDDGLHLGQFALRKSAQQCCRRADRRQGVAQLVGQHGQKFQLLPVSMLCGSLKFLRRECSQYELLVRLLQLRMPTLVLGQCQVVGAQGPLQRRECRRFGNAGADPCSQRAAPDDTDLGTKRYRHPREPGAQLLTAAPTCRIYVANRVDNVLRHQRDNLLNGWRVESLRAPARPR
jgi:hypothetical protein